MIVQGAQNLSPLHRLEQRLIQEMEFSEDERAACLARVQGDATIQIPER
jgi:ferredoxin